ncbi:MAG: hypothetical protein DRJ05_16880, partial [Bacteroidetes bacterium]
NNSVKTKYAMKTIVLLATLLLMGILPGFGQYLINPSFEDDLTIIGPPHDWDICIVGSTPNIQPGKYNIYLPPSDGNSYIGLFTRLEGTVEDTEANFETPLSKDSCYIFKIDLAYQQHLTYNDVDPITLKIYGDEVFCQKDNLLWQSPIIDNTEWMEFEFLVHNEDFDIHDLVLEADFNNPSYPSWGYILIDNIRITPTPLIDLGNDTTIIVCEGGVGFDLDPGEGFSEYLWQDGSEGQTFFADTTGLYWVQVTTSEGCTASDSIMVTVEEYEDMVIENSGDIGICLGQETMIWINVINGQPPFNYEWEGIPGGGDTIYVSPETTTTYYVTITDNCNGIAYDSVTVAVLPSPEVDLGNDTIICGSDSLVLNAGSGYFSYIWQDQSTAVTYTVTEAGTYWVQVTSVNGCPTIDEITVDFFPAVDVNLGNDTIICLGENVVLDPGEGFTELEWQDGSTGQTFIVFETGIYHITATDINGCQGIDSILVVVDDTQTTVDLGIDTTVCPGDPYIIDPGFYLEYLWQDGSTEPTYVVTQEGLYYVNVLGGCNWATDSIYIDYHPPTEVDLGTDTSMCMGQYITLDVGFGFHSIEWQDGSTSNTLNVYESGLYFVTVEDNHFCTGGDTIVVQIGTEVDIVEDTVSFCAGETIVVDAGFGFDYYTWDSGSTDRYEDINEGGWYFVEVSYTYECPSSDSVFAIMMALPVCDLVEGPLCEGDTIVLSGPDGDFNYYWNGEPGGQTVDVVSGGTYQLLVMNDCGEASDEVTITEYPLPEVNLGEDILLFPGEETQVDAGEFVSYEWQDGSTGQYFTVSFDDGADSLQVEVFDGFCKNSDAVQVEVYNVNVPLAITPNGDGFNDTFIPKGDFTGINENIMTVYNRWGEKVWESSDFLSGWDGKTNGRYVAEGTYFWVLQVKYGNENLSKVYKGSLTVLGTN